MTSTNKPLKKSLFTEKEIFALLRTFYPREACALLPQVADRTGSPTRHADAIAMQLWPSRGLTIDGIEIKVDRRDWLRELEKPSKADVIYRFCDRWYIAAPTGVVVKTELPETWGLLEVVTEKDSYVVKETVPAPKNKDVMEPGRPFLAALMRALQKEHVSETELKAVREEATAHAWERAEQQIKNIQERAKVDIDRYRRAIAVFEEASGIRIDGSFPDQNKGLGETVRALLNARNAVANTLRTLRVTQANAEEAVKLAARLIANLEEVQDVQSPAK